jgi:predicted GH43/DUF377 family glycosyl hydrolase
MSFRLTKHPFNPILVPEPQHDWESLSVCNPGAWYENGTFYLLYRAAGKEAEHRICFGLATSRDGFHFERASDMPVLRPSADGYDAGCIEDPRIIKMDGHFLVTYAFRPIPPGRYWLNPGFAAARPYASETVLPVFFRENRTRSGLLISRDLREFHRVGPLTRPDCDDRDVVMFPEKVGGKFVMLHRPAGEPQVQYGCVRPSIGIAFADDLLMWTEDHLLLEPAFNWEEKKIGGSTPPLRTPKGWLVLYHGVDANDIYRVGALLLDIEQPRRILARTREPILEPEHDYETRGLMPCGVVFPTGNVIVDGTLFVYYGAADTTIGVATAPLSEVLDHLCQA